MLPSPPLPCGIYLSYPFCSQKCTYCNFASGVFPDRLQAQYLAALEREIAEYPWKEAPDTVYLGGGTPSQMPVAALASILGRIPGRPWREATMEASPGSLTGANIEAWLAAGINRVSLGVQSFSSAELARTGRKHTAETVAADIALLRSAGLGNMNLDLIAGLPGQTAASWRESLAHIERLAPPHVSVYMLEVDEDSRLGQEVLLNGKRYGAPDVPSDESIAEFYETAVEVLADCGIARYEISNFAAAGSESHHNLKYWRRLPYAGFGADAHSFDGARRWANVEDAREYVRRSLQGEAIQLESTACDAAEEKFFVGLRLSEGIEPDAPESLRWQEPIARFASAGLLEKNGPRLRLTDRGVLLSNEVFAEFVNS